MWGGSYAGFDQWVTLKEFPPHLRTIVPAAAAHAAVDFPFYKNIFFPYEMQWLTFTSGVTPNASLFGESSFWIKRFRELYLNHLPFSKLDQVVGNNSTHFQTWIQHPTPDAYWETMALTPAQYEHIDVPILTITGHYDGDQPGAMYYYRMHMQLGSPEGRAQHYLIIGPWDHAGTRTPNKEFGGLEFGEACMLDLNNLHKEWYDWTLKGGPKPEFLKKRVAYYVMGAEEWKYADSLEAISNATQRLYLNSTGGHANDVFHSGTLDEAAPDRSQPDQYVYDPLDVRPAELEREEVKNYLTDQTYALDLFGNGLVYHSAPFNKDAEIAGYVRFVAWISLDVPDTDFQVTISEILPDGSHIRLTQDLMRARYRESLKQEKLVTPGEINRYEFDGFMFFSRRIAKGSRLRLLISSPNTIYLQKNYNGGGIVAQESGQDARTAHVTLYHDAEHPSFLELPMVTEMETD
jgi:putative CocE/NonD family hydrolase